MRKASISCLFIYLKMPFFMKYDVAFNPIDITFFCFIGIMFETNDISNLFKQFFMRFYHQNDIQKKS